MQTEWARLVALVAALLVAGPSIAAERSREVAAQFQHANPCPSTGKRFGACPGYVKDHINPLCNGGLDAVSSMQWQTIADARTKDRWERAICRAKQWERKGGAG
jgi:hypothetical protein